MSIPLVVTKWYEGQRVTTRCSDQQKSYRDKTLSRSNQPWTSETYRRQDDVFGYEQQFLLCNLDIVGAPVGIRESGRKEKSSRVSTGFSLGVENGRADAEQVRFARSNSLSANGDREIFIFPL